MLSILNGSSGTSYPITCSLFDVSATPATLDVTRASGDATGKALYADLLRHVLWQRGSDDSDVGGQFAHERSMAPPASLNVATAPGRGDVALPLSYAPALCFTPAVPISIPPPGFLVRACASAMSV